MSTYLYGRVTTLREESEPGTSRDTGQPGAKTFIDSLAALVPAEMLIAHAVIMAEGSTTTKSADGDPVTTITNPGTLKTFFFVLIALNVAVFVIARWGHLKMPDVLRGLIPPLAFIGWTMLQKSTMFDALQLEWSNLARYGTAIIGAIVLAALASKLAMKADGEPPAGGGGGALPPPVA